MPGLSVYERRRSAAEGAFRLAEERNNLKIYGLAAELYKEAAEHGDTIRNLRRAATAARRAREVVALESISTAMRVEILLRRAVRGESTSVAAETLDGAYDMVAKANAKFSIGMYEEASSILERASSETDNEKLSHMLLRTAVRFKEMHVDAVRREKGPDEAERMAIKAADFAIGVGCHTEGRRILEKEVERRERAMQFWRDRGSVENVLRNAKVALWIAGKIGDPEVIGRIKAAIGVTEA